MEVKIINKSTNPLPAYETSASAGMDVRASLTENIVLKPLERTLIPTGLFVELPVGYEMQVRPRSGLAAKYGITVLNSPGTIDADYRGEIKVILVNLSADPFEIRHGERIAQLVVARHERAELIPADHLSDTERGIGGFGSTGGVSKDSFGKLDDKFEEIARWVVSSQEGSTSAIQRNFEIGYNRAGRITDQLEKAGIVGRSNGPKPREVLIYDLATLERVLAEIM